jgi:hypothetical protein
MGKWRIIVYYNRKLAISLPTVDLYQHWINMEAIRKQRIWVSHPFQQDNERTPVGGHPLISLGSVRDIPFCLVIMTHISPSEVVLGVQNVQYFIILRWNRPEEQIYCAVKYTAFHIPTNSME